MKKILAFTCAALMCAAACNKNEKSIAVTSISLNPTTATLTVGDTLTLTAAVLPENADNKAVTWTSSNINVVAVNGGIATAKAVGTATITAATEDGNHTAHCTISVSLPLLRIVQLCDPQLGFGGFDSDVANLEAAAILINSIEPDMVLIAGDMVNDFSQENAISTVLSIIAKINAPVMMTPGNHDLPTTNNPVTTASLQFYRAHFGEDFSVAECRERCIIAANSMLWWREAPAEEINRHDSLLSNALQTAKSKAQSVVMLTHIPPFISSADEEDEYFNIPKTKRKELLNLFEENGVILWLSGHTHTTFRNTHGSITLLNGETTCNNFDGRPFGFRLLTLFSDNSFEWEFIPL